MKKFLPVLRNSPFFKGLTDDEILSILHCVEATTVSKETRFLYFQSSRFYRSNGTCGVRLCSCYSGRPFGGIEIFYQNVMPVIFSENHMRQVRVLF